MGLWRPDAAALGAIRKAIVESPDRWRRAKNDKRFAARFTLEGESLKSAPRGFAADHPLVEDLKRTDFVGWCNLSRAEVLGDGLLDLVAKSLAASRPLMRFLCHALQVPF
jgi:uncharacterized protein (TIGR02453 family)